MVSATPQPLYPQVKAPIPIEQEAGWTSEPDWTGTEKDKKKSHARPGFELRTVQHVASRYADYTNV